MGKKKVIKIIPEKESEDEENIPWNDFIEGLKEAVEYAQGIKSAFVTRYVGNERVSAQWQMVDGTKVDPPEDLKK